MQANTLMRTYAYLCSRLNHPNYYNRLDIRVHQQTNFKLVHITREIPSKRRRMKFHMSRSAIIDKKRNCFRIN